MAEETAVKPGWKSTEFWLSTVATLVGLVMASGILDTVADTHWSVRVIGGVVAVLAALGYTSSRAKLKAPV